MLCSVPLNLLRIASFPLRNFLQIIKIPILLIDILSSEKVATTILKDLRRILTSRVFLPFSSFL